MCKQAFGYSADEVLVREPTVFETYRFYCFDLYGWNLIPCDNDAIDLATIKAFICFGRSELPVCEKTGCAYALLCLMKLMKNPDADLEAPEKAIGICIPCLLGWKCNLLELHKSLKIRYDDAPTTNAWTENHFYAIRGNLALSVLNLDDTHFTKLIEPSSGGVNRNGPFLDEASVMIDDEEDGGYRKK